MKCILNGFSGYKQVKMAPKNMEKNTFIMEWSAFAYQTS